MKYINEDGLVEVIVGLFFVCPVLGAFAWAAFEYFYDCIQLMKLGAIQDTFSFVFECIGMFFWYILALGLLGSSEKLASVAGFMLMAAVIAIGTSIVATAMVQVVALIVLGALPIVGAAIGLVTLLVTAK